MIDFLAFMGLTSITNIPKIMRAKGWANGAQLMEKWFSGPPVAKPAYTKPDLATIKMDGWVLSFPRAKAVFETMARDKVWSNEKAKPILSARFQALGLLGLGSSFDFSSMDTPRLHALEVNFRAVESGYSSPLDGMTAALGNFSIYVSPFTGEITKENGRFRVKLMRVGFHIMDSFDFQGDQELGYWDETANQVSASRTLSGTNVTNKSFRDWRATNHKGGDFLVYSDIKSFSISPPDSFLI